MGGINLDFDQKGDLGLSAAGGGRIGFDGPTKSPGKTVLLKQFIFFRSVTCREFRLRGTPWIGRRRIFRAETDFSNTGKSSPIQNTCQTESNAA
jgi:hypothetical protein